MYAHTYTYTYTHIHTHVHTHTHTHTHTHMYTHTHTPLSNPATTAARYLDVRMTSVAGAKLATAALLLVVRVELGLAKDGHTPVAVLEGKSAAAVQPLFVLRLDGQHDGDRLIGDPT